MRGQRMNDSRQEYFRAPDILSINAITRNLLTIGLLFATLIFHRTASMPSRLRIRSAGKDGGFVFPGTEEHRQDTETEGRAMKQATSPQENYIEPTGNIVFPTEKSEPRLDVFTPGPAQECKTKTYCENTDSYPANYVNNMIEKHEDLKFLAGIDEVDDSIAHRIDDDAAALCMSEERLIYPTSAQNREENWLFVLNQDNFRQGVRIETCLTSDSECSVIGGLIAGYKTMCKQKYILRQLAAITPNGTVVRDLFKLPSSCCCQVKFDGSYNRMGINLRFKPNNQTQDSMA